MEDNAPPPSYDASEVGPPKFTKRPTTLEKKPKDTISHYINVVPHASPLTFPYPEPSQVWTARDVQQEDWAIFVSNLLYIEPKSDYKDDKRDHLDSSEEEYKILQKMYATLADWNENFFNPRGLKVVAGGETSATREQSAAALANQQGESSKSGWKFGQQNKFGFQMGSVLLGVEMPDLKSEQKSEK